MDVMQIANGIPMWIACGIPVVLVVIQAVLFAEGRTVQERRWDLVRTR